MDALTKRVLNVADAKHKAAFADATARAMAEHCDARITKKDAELERMDKLLARAADALNNGTRMSEMDLGSEIAEFRRQRHAAPKPMEQQT